MVAVGQTKEPIITLRNVSKHYRNHYAVDSLDLCINKGESLALIGHNGAGKTTLLKLILGLTRPNTGSIADFRQKIYRFLARDSFVPKFNDR